MSLRAKRVLAHQTAARLRPFVGERSPLEVARRTAEFFEVTLDYFVDEEVDEFTLVMVRDESLARRLELFGQLE